MQRLCRAPSEFHCPTRCRRRKSQNLWWQCQEIQIQSYQIIWPFNNVYSLHHLRCLTRKFFCCICNSLAVSVPFSSLDMNTNVTWSGKDRSTAHRWTSRKPQVELGPMIVEVDVFGAQYVLGIRFVFCSLGGADAEPGPSQILRVD